MTMKRHWVLTWSFGLAFYDVSEEAEFNLKTFGLVGIEQIGICYSNYMPPSSNGKG